MKKEGKGRVGIFFLSFSLSPSFPSSTKLHECGNFGGSACSKRNEEDHRATEPHASFKPRRNPRDHILILSTKKSEQKKGMVCVEKKKRGVADIFIQRNNLHHLESFLEHSKLTFFLVFVLGSQVLEHHWRGGEVAAIRCRQGIVDNERNLRRGIRFGKPSEGRRAGQANEETV
jgi:hypothetical protein